MTTKHDLDDRLFQILVEAVSDQAIYMLDPAGRIRSWNAAAERIKGYRRDEVLGEDFGRFFTPEDQQAGRPEQILAEAGETGRVETEGWRLRKDGTRFWALAAVHAIRGEDGELIGFAKVTRDMTERRAAQQALLESERRFRYLVEGVVDYAIYMLDVNGTVSNWNAGAQRIKGYAADEVVGRHFSIFYTPQDRASGRPARALKIALREGRFEAEGWRQRKDGSQFWASVVIDPIYDDDGRHIGYAKITRDTSDKRAAAEALAASERQFRLLVAGVVDYALYMLDPNGVVTNWNAGAAHIKGYASHEIVGQHFSRFYTEPDRLAGVPVHALETARAQGRYEAEGWRVRKDGGLFWASVVIDAIYEDGELVGFAKITRDITERRNAQLELQKAHERLGQAQKMEAIGQLTGGVAHDFNNLLMVVSGQTQLLRKRLAEDARALRALDAIEAASRRGQDLTRHLLSFARRQRLQPVPVSLNERAEGLRELLGTSIGSSVRLELELPADLWHIQVDPSELELALLNLAVNARDAMPSGGVLSVRAHNRTVAAGEIDTDVAGEFVALTVRDTGVGIPPDVLARVFEPFFTTKEVNKGTGLGLSQVYGFAQQSGGRATIDSRLGAGTTITLYLPRAQTAAAAAAAEGPEPVARTADILVVEDNPEVADVVARLLEQLGNRVQTVNSAQAALTALSEGAEPDLVFTDIVMAGELDGLGLARRLREERPGLPVLLATGYSQAAERMGDEFPVLAKPYSLPELSRAIAASLDPRQARLVSA
ncbi:PAS domain S-box protein [Phenylobacterium sp.]|uniref:PAS domain S-box protein n=1 Tax=Phenylobacterium sp. TaxID=1871053 RepID=UPI003783CD9A